MPGVISPQRCRRLYDRLRIETSCFAIDCNDGRVTPGSPNFKLMTARFELFLCCRIGTVAFDKHFIRKMLMVYGES